MGKKTAPLTRGRGGVPRAAPAASVPRVARGRLITIEGLDGAGKTTLATALAAALAPRVGHVELLREPGRVTAAERVRELVKDPGLEISDRAEALLYAAARAQLVAQRLGPLFEAGAWGVPDPFV